MQYAILAVEAAGISDFVKMFKRKIAPELRAGTFALVSEIGDKPGVFKILTIGLQARLWRFRGPYYEAFMIFVRETKSRILIIIYARYPMYGRYVNTDSELKAVGSIMEQIMAVAKDANVLYNSAWVYDDDEKIREKAILGLEKLDDHMALERLASLLRHDRSEAIREKAAWFLGRIGGKEAAEVLERTVRSYINGTRSRHSVAATCAQALGTMRSREALESLNELLVIFVKRQLEAEARTVKQAIYRIEHGTDLEETLCIVCNQPVEEGAELLQCPTCRGVAHREHLLEWLHVKDYCPKCSRHVDEASFRKIRRSNLSSESLAPRSIKKNKSEA